MSKPDTSTRMPATRMPALFVGHGSPMNAIEDNEFTRAWSDVARKIPEPSAIVTVSAHWETEGVFVGAAAEPETIHDFYGFPRALNEMRYPAPGDPVLTGRIAKLLAPVRAARDFTRGFDHGVWSVLAVMYPDAGVPVVQVSLDTTRAGEFHGRVGELLAPLRDEGVLFLATGNIVHNLSVFRFHDPTPLPWAIEFDEEVQRLVRAGDRAALDTLADCAKLPHAELAVPHPEHYLPLLYAIAMRRPGERATLFNTQVLSSISMTSVLVGGGA